MSYDGIPEDKPTSDEFKRYLAVQMSGCYNMLSRDAELSVNIGRNKYDYIIRNYAFLRDEYHIDIRTDEELQKMISNMKERGCIDG